MPEIKNSSIDERKKQFNISVLLGRSYVCTFRQGL